MTGRSVMIAILLTLICCALQTSAKELAFYFEPTKLDVGNVYVYQLSSNPEKFEPSTLVHYYFASLTIVEKGLGKIRVPRANPGNCGAVAFNSYVVDPRGDLYKCWNNIGREELKVGTLKEGPRFERNLVRWLAFDPFLDEECRECEMLPICMGGCPYVRVTEGKKRCLPMKYNVRDVLGFLQNHDSSENEAIK